MLKLNGRKLIKTETEPLYDVLKIQYVPNEKIYRVIYNKQSYLLSKENNMLVWNLPQNLLGSQLDIRVQAFDENTGKSLYVTNNVVVKSSPYQFAVTNQNVDTFGILTPLMIESFENVIDNYNSNYPIYMMSDEHPVIHIIDRRIEMPTNYPIVVSRDNVSQLLTFDMNRYYDGVDLYEKSCTFQYINASGISGEAMATNVFADDQKMIVGWLLDSNVTETAGKVQFKIVCKGQNEYEQLYIWQTLDAAFSVEKSLFIIDTDIIERYPSVLEDILIKLRALEMRIDALDGLGNSPDTGGGEWINIDT